MTQGSANGMERVPPYQPAIPYIAEEFLIALKVKR